VALASLSGLAACSESEFGATDAYRVGCPTLDAVLGGGAIANKAGVATLRKLSEQPELGEEARQWFAAAAPVLENANADDLPADTKAVLVDGCNDNGYKLQNLQK
jgi:hypothetical protein